MKGPKMAQSTAFPRGGTAIRIACTFCATVLACVLASYSITSATSAPDRASSAAKLPKGDIVVGAAIPLTGALASIGAQMNLAVKYAASQINKAGGIDGHDVKIVERDTGLDPTQAVQAVTALLTSSHVNVLVGPATTDQVAGTNAQVVQSGIPQLQGSGSPTYGPSTAPYAIGYTASNAAQADAMVNWAVKKGYKTAGILNDNGSYGQEGAQAISAAAKRAGIKVVVDASYAAGTANFTPVALQLHGAHPDTVFLYPDNGTDTGNALKAFQSLSWNVPVIGGYGATFEAQALAAGGANVYRNTVAVTYPGAGACAANDISSAAKTFYNGIHKMNPTVAAESQSDFVAIVYDGVRLLAAGIAGSKSVSGASVIKWLDANSTRQTKGYVEAPFDINASSHFMTGNSHLIVVKPGNPLGYGVSQKVDC
jgi:ABC-type branched-subunit amino acid transport system substrate-binding protein